MISATNLGAVKAAGVNSGAHKLVDRIAYYIWERGSRRGSGWDWCEAQNMVADHWADGLNIETGILDGIRVADGDEECYLDKAAKSAISCYNPDASVWSDDGRVK
jgi:hypothetical protein